MTGGWKGPGPRNGSRDVMRVPDSLPGTITALVIVAGAAIAGVAIVAWMRAGKPRVFSMKKP